MQQILVFLLFIAAAVWSVAFLWSPVSIFWGTLFNDCKNGFSYDPVAERCNCEMPFNGTFCEIDLCENGEAKLGSFGWQCECTDEWFGALCDVCGTHDAACKGSLPYPNGNKCRTELVADGVEVEFLGPSCDLICVKEDNYRFLQGRALESYEFYLAKAPLNTLGCPGALCYGCDPISREAQCIDGALRSFGSKECDISCAPCTNSFCKPCNLRGICRLQGDTPICQCDALTRGAECETICPGVTETFNGISSTLTGPECSSNGLCNDDGLCECNEDASGNSLFLGTACDVRCPTDTAGQVCSGHGSCEPSGTDAACACDDGWFGPSCGCSDGSAATKTCLHGECLEDVEGCACHDDDILGHWSGEFCSVCAQNWFSEDSFCLQYCNPETTCNGNAAFCRAPETIRNEEGLVVPCTTTELADGTLALSGSCATCSCEATFNTTAQKATDGLSLFQQCAQCIDDYYPKLGTSVEPAGTPFCSVQCDSDKCHERGVCVRNSGSCDCHGSCQAAASNTDGQCQMLEGSTVIQPSFLSTQDCAVCAEHWGPDIKGERFWPSSCRYYCNPLATETDTFPSSCYALDGTIREECVFCSGRADNCSSLNSIPTCNCKDGYTGDYCQSTCGANGAASCNDGQCVSDDLANWFDLSTPSYQKDTDPSNGRTGSWRCACNPQDIGLEERDTYEEAFYMISKYGAGLETTTEELPPRPEFFGLQCTANCPRVADKACDGRGFCKSFPTGLSEEYCSVDSECSRLSDSAEDDDRYCYLEKRPRFWEYISKLPPATLPACSTTELDWINSFVDTHDWNRFCYNYMSQAVPPQTHTGYCRDCAKLVDSPALWQEVNEKCAALVEYSNFETLQGFTKDCSAKCTMSVAAFDWNAWCRFPSTDFLDTCPASCHAEFQRVDWVSDGGFCSTLQGYLQNHQLVGLACAPFREEDQTRGRDHDSCRQVDGSSEYDSSSRCFVRRKTIKNAFGATIVQPFSGTEHQIQCRGLSQGHPEVCGSEEHRIVYNDSATSEAKAYCSAKYAVGWSHFASNAYVVETRILNHSVTEYTTPTQAAVLVSEVEEVLGGDIADAAVVFYRGEDGLRHEGILIGECVLDAPVCYSCGEGDSMRNGTGALLTKAQNPKPESCCKPDDYFQESPSKDRFWCHNVDTIGTDNCRYERCSAAIKAFDWKSQLQRMDTVNGLDGADIPELKLASVRRSFSLQSYCDDRLVLDNSVRSEASGVNAFDEYCRWIDESQQVYGIGGALFVEYFDNQEVSTPELAKLQIAKRAWWQSVGIGDVLASYDEEHWFLTDPAVGRLSRNTLRASQVAGSDAYAVSVWVYLPAEPYGEIFNLRLSDSQGSLRWAQAAGSILDLTVRFGRLYANFEATEFQLGSVGEWVHVVVYPDWGAKELEIEIAEAVSVQRSMLCKSDPSACHVFETEAVYGNFLDGLYAQKYTSTAGAFDLTYTDGEAASSAAACQAQQPDSAFFLYSGSSGLCQFYGAAEGIETASFTDTSATDDQMFVYQKNAVLSTSLRLDRIEVLSKESENVHLHDLRIVGQGGSLVGTYLARALSSNGRAATLGSSDCTSFLTTPTIPELGQFPEAEIASRRWGRICEDFYDTLDIPETTRDAFCLSDPTCKGIVDDFLENGQASDWYYAFANEARPNETKTEGCANVPEACDILLETYDYEEACDLSLREVYENCEDSCSETFTNWRSGQTTPAFNKTGFCQSLSTASEGIGEMFNEAVGECSDGCQVASAEVNFLDFCSDRLVTHDVHAPYVMTHNVSSYCRRQIFQGLANELKGTEYELNYSQDCQRLGERGSTRIVNDKPGVCHRVSCECTEFGMSGDRCNIECTVGATSNSPCNEAAGLGMCCLSPRDGQELSFLNCQTDYAPDESSYTVGECLCLNRGTSKLISGVNCDSECAKCGESHGSCSRTSGTCVCQNNEYMETVHSHAAVVQNASYDAIDEQLAETPLVFDWANAETSDALLEGDIRTQTAVVLLYDDSVGCGTGLDRCCDWTDEQAPINPLDPSYALNALVEHEGPFDRACVAEESFEACLQACLDDPACQSVHYEGESVGLSGKTGGWPLKGQLKLSSFALNQEPLNYLPGTSTLAGFTDQKCKAYGLQAGRYRVLLQDGLYARAESCGIGSGTSEAMESYASVRLAYEACQDDTECSGFVHLSGPSYALFSGYTSAADGCQVVTEAKPALLPRPLATSTEVIYRSNWCRTKDYFDISGNKHAVAERAFGLIASVECDEVEQFASSYEDCQFPFYIPVYDPFRGDFVTQKITECTDLNIVDGYLGHSVVRDASGISQSSVLLDFQSMKAEITQTMGIQEPTYCVSASWFQNVSEHIEADLKGEGFSTCRKNNYRRSKCTRDPLDSGEGNCKCGAEVCSENQYCYEKVVGSVVMNECHSCDDMLSPAPQQCCQVGESLQFVRDSALRCIPDDHSDYQSYCNASWVCPRNWGQSTSTGSDEYLFEGQSFAKGKGPRPELFCENTCWNHATQSCGCEDCSAYPSPVEVLREGRVGGHHRAVVSGDSFAYTTTLEGVEIPFLRVCKDRNAGAVNNSQFALSTDKEKDFRDSEFIRKDKNAASNPSSRCGVDCQELCPGIDPKTDVPCNGRGQCNNDCQCSCFSLDAISDRTYFLTALRGGGLGEVPDYTISSSKSPYRGTACENVCPGFDVRYADIELSDADKLYVMDELVCSGHGSCLLNQQGTTQCTCESGFESGSTGACEFHCPGAGLCSGHGSCSIQPIGSSGAFVEGLVRIYSDLTETDVVKRLTINSARKATIELETEKVLHRGLAVRFTGIAPLPENQFFEIAEVVDSKSFFFHVDDSITEGTWLGGNMVDTEFLNYDPAVRQTTASHRMTSYIFDTNTLESAYSVTDNRYYVSPDAREAIDSLLPQVKYLSACPDAYPYVYHHGLYCCQFENSANGTFLNRNSNISDCPRRQRMSCPTIEWYEQEAGLSERFGVDSRFVKKDGKKELSFFCRKTVLTTGEQALCDIERRELNGNIFSTNAMHYTCDASIDMARMVRDSRPYYDSLAILELGAGRTEGLLYTYEDVHCKNIVPSTLNANGLTLKEQPQPISLLECAVCGCQNSAESGFWAGVKCDECSFGFSGESCRGTCAGVCSKIAVGSNLMWYEEYQNALAISKPCDNPTRNGFFYSCPVKSDLKEITEASGRQWDDGDIAEGGSDTGYERAIFCQDGRNSGGSCVRCKTPFVGTIDLAFEDAPERTCNRLTCPRMDTKLKEINKLEGEFSINLALSLWQSNFLFSLYGTDPNIAYEANAERALSRSMPIDLFQPCPATHKDLYDKTCCLETCATLSFENIDGLTKRLQFVHDHTKTITSASACAAKALSEEKYPIYAADVIVGYSESSYFHASKGFFAMVGPETSKECFVYKAFESYSLDYYRGPNDANTVNGMTAFTSQTINEFIDAANYRAYYACGPDCIEKPISKQIRLWEGTETMAEHTTAVTTTYEIACLFNNDYASILLKGQDSVEDGLLERSLDLYADSDSATGSVTELVALIQKDRCTARFFEFCRQGHQLDFQNPFLTWYAFMKLDEYLDEAYPEGSNQANKCDWSLYKGKLWCPQCPRCKYIGEIPGVDLELDTSQECDIGYFPYCKAATSGCSAAHWQTSSSCALPSFAPNYALKDAQRQTVDLVNSTRLSLGKHSAEACATIAMGQTKQGYFFYEGCEQGDCECFAYTDIGTGDLKLVTDGYLYVIDYSSTFGRINPFERYIAQFMVDSADGSDDYKGWMVEKMRQAVPDRYRAFSVGANGTFMEEYRQWLECTCVEGEGNELDRDWCADFDITRCVYFNPVQLEWELLWHDQGDRTNNELPQKELGQTHDPKGSGAVLRMGGRMKSDIKRIEVTAPSTCTETLSEVSSADYQNTQYLASQLECGFGESIHCLVPEGNRTNGYFDYRPERVQDASGRTVSHYRCKEKVASQTSIDQCANEAKKRFAVYEGRPWLSRGYFAVERPQLDASLFSAHRDYEIYDFDSSAELDCYVYTEVDLAVIRSGTWNGLDESFCSAGVDRKNDNGCARAAVLFSSNVDGCTDCDSTLDIYGGDCNEPEFVRSYYIPNLSDAGGFPSFTVTPLTTGLLTCYAYGPCFSATEEWLGCRPTLFTGTTTSLHYPYYSETPLHEMTEVQKQTTGVANLETTTFEVSFGFWTEVRDKVAGQGSLYQTYEEDWLNLCYDDLKLDDREKVLLGNRELYRPNDYTRYDLLYMGLTCPPFASKHQLYHANNNGRFAATQWANGLVFNRMNEYMEGSGHTKLMRIRVEGQQANYVHFYAVVVLDAGQVDMTQLSLSNSSINYDSALKPYCDAGVQRDKRYGPCVNLKGSSVNGKVYWKSGAQSVKLQEFPLQSSTLPHSVNGDLYIEHDSVVLVYQDLEYYGIESFHAVSERVVDPSVFQIYKDTQTANTAIARSMFGTLYQEQNAGLSLTADACAPMSQDLSGLSSQLKADDYGGTASSDGMMHFRSQGEDEGFAPSCGCKAGFSNTRYSNYNQPWQLQAGCSAPEGDRTGTMIDYRRCFGQGSCSDYDDPTSDTGEKMLCAGFDIISTSYNKVCLTKDGTPYTTECNRPFGGCQFKQRNALNIDATEVECGSPRDESETLSGMAQKWVSPHYQNFVISADQPRTQYVGDDPTLGVVYLGGMPKDRARSNFNFLTTGCHACTNGRFQDDTNAADCRGCPDGTYNIDNRNPWRIPPIADGLGNLPQNRWKLTEPVFEYEWWRIKGYPTANVDLWHEVDEWQTQGPLLPYYKDDSGHWKYDSLRSLRPSLDPGWVEGKQVQTDCEPCPDNWASIPLTQNNSKDGDPRYGYPALPARSTGGNRNCLICPPGYDTGDADHISGGATPATGGLQECPVKFPYAFSTKEKAPYYGSHCCNEKVDRIGDAFSYAYFYDTAEEACPSGSCNVARRDLVCLRGTYGTAEGAGLIERQAVQSNNVEFCKAVASRLCKAGVGGVLYEPLEAAYDDCRCLGQVTKEQLPQNDTGKLSCFPRRQWVDKGDCQFTKFVGKTFYFHAEGLEKDIHYPLHLTETSRASAQYELDSSTPLVYRLKETLSYTEQCEALASAEPDVHRFSVDEVSGECKLVYYSDNREQQQFQEQSQECKADDGWHSYELKLSAQDSGGYTEYKFTKESCEDDYAYRTVERREAWPVPVNTTDLMPYFVEKRPYGAAVERIDNSSHANFSAAAEECMGLVNCVGVGTDSALGVVRGYFAAKHDDAFDSVIKDQEEQSPFHYRLKEIVDVPFETKGYYYECQGSADIASTAETRTMEVNCTYQPYKCYTECRAFAVSLNATAFTYPSFPLGEGMPVGTLCKAYLGEADFTRIGEYMDFAGEHEILQKSACLQRKNKFGGGYVECDSVYGAGLDSQNGFYCADYDYRMHPEDYNSGDHSLVGMESLHKTCLVQKLSRTGICETESELGTCTSYNIHGECQTYNYLGERVRRNEDITVTEQDQRGLCVQEDSLGTCTEDSRHGSCDEQPPYRMGVKHENPIGNCSGEAKRITECEGEWKANATVIEGNFNTENKYKGPFTEQHTSAVLLKTVAFLHEDSLHHCERACSTLEGCTAYAVSNEPLETHEEAPLLVAKRRDCALYGNVSGIGSFPELSLSVALRNDTAWLWFYGARAYSGRAQSSDSLVVFRTVEDTFGEGCAALCDGIDACLAYAYNATKHCELLSERPSLESLYVEAAEGVVVSIATRHPETYGSFAEAYAACELRHQAHNPLTTASADACLGIELSGGSYKLIQSVHRGGDSAIADQKSFSETLPACYDSHTAADVAACSAIADTVPYSPRYPEEEPRYASIDYFSFSAPDCRVMRAGYSLATCPLVPVSGHVAYEKLADDSLPRYVTGSSVWTNRRDAGVLDVSPVREAFDDYHGVLGECSRQIGTGMETPMECIGAAVDYPNDAKILEGRFINDTDVVCETENDRGTMLTENRLGSCRATSDYGDCYRETQHGVCTKHTGKGQCLEFSTCQNSVLGSVAKGVCAYKNRYGDCEYETQLGTCELKSKLGTCSYEDRGGTCAYDNPDGKCVREKTNYSVSVYLESVDTGEHIQLMPTQATGTLPKGLFFLDKYIRINNNVYMSSNRPIEECASACSGYDYFAYMEIKGYMDCICTPLGGKDMVDEHEHTKAGIIYKNVVDSADAQFQIDNIKHDDLPVASFKANYVPYDALFSGISVPSGDTLEEACLADENCKGITPETNTVGYASEASVVNAYTQAKRMERHHLEMYNTRNYMIYHTGSVHDATMRYNYGAARDFLINNDDFDACKGLCENYAMNYDDVAEGSYYYPTRWFHQTLLDYAGRYICRCQQDPTLECPSGSIMHTNGEQKLGTLQSFREQEHAGTLATLWTSFPKTVPDFPMNHWTGIWDVVCEGCPMGTYAYALVPDPSNPFESDPNNPFRCYYTFSSSCQKPACAPCPDGYYNDQIGQTECTKKCPVGRFYSDATRKANTALWGQVECTVCTAGEYQNEEGKGACKTCSAGQYQDTTGNSGCKNCPAGKATDLVQGQGHADRTACQSCGVGRVASSGQVYCINCLAMYFNSPSSWRAGQYQNEEGQTSCKTCGLTETTLSNAAPACVSCPTGKRASSNYIGTCGNCWYGEYQDQLGQTTCKSCIAGQYNSQTGRSSCTNCNTGRYSGGGATECTDCPNGQYQDSGGQSSCKNCPAGRWAYSGSQWDGAYSYSSCMACSAGRYSGAASTGASGSHACTSCPVGKYAQSSGTATCSDCVAGKYASSTGNAYCNTCPTGYFSPSSGRQWCSTCDFENNHYYKPPQYGGSDAELLAVNHPSNYRYVYAHAGECNGGSEASRGYKYGTWSQRVKQCGDACQSYTGFIVYYHHGATKSYCACETVSSATCSKKSDGYIRFDVYPVAKDAVECDYYFSGGYMLANGATLNSYSTGSQGSLSKVYVGGWDMLHWSSLTYYDSSPYDKRCQIHAQMYGTTSRVEQNGNYRCLVYTILNREGSNSNLGPWDSFHADDRSFHVRSGMGTLSYAHSQVRCGVGWIYMNFRCYQTMGSTATSVGGTTSTCQPVYDHCAKYGGGGHVATQYEINFFIEKGFYYTQRYGITSTYNGNDHWLKNYGGDYGWHGKNYCGSDRWFVCVRDA